MIWHTVPVLSEELEFGGPARVAINLVDALRRRGRESALIGGALPGTRPPLLADGDRARRRRLLVPFGSNPFVLGTAPRLLWELMTARKGPELVHVHGGRDLFSVSIALILRARRIPFVLQTHGMIEPPVSKARHWFDATVLAAAYGSATAVLALTPTEERWLAGLLRRPRVRQLGNAIPLAEIKLDDQPRRAVLFLARLHPRKGAVQFARVATRLVSARPEIEVIVAGPDEGDLGRVQDLIGGYDPSVRYVGAVPQHQVLERMREASVYVLPAEGEPFGMTLLEAWSVGTPVVMHESSALADRAVAAGAASTFDGTDDDLERVILQLLGDDGTRAEMSRSARSFARLQFGIERHLDELVALYDQIDDAAAGGRI